MEVPKNFSERLTAIAETTPREVLANVLAALTPRVPVQTRAPSEWSPEERRLAPPPRIAPAPGPFKRLTRIRRKGTTHYDVLVPSAYNNHKRHTWTFAMVYCIVHNTNTAGAADMLAERWPEYVSKNFDLLWLSKVGYIRI